MDKPPLPSKPYFRIGEVAEILGVETYVLRYWESEFPQLKPVRAPSRQRLYRRADVETLLYIKGLLHEQGYTIAGAKRRLDEMKAAGAPLPPAKGQQSLALAMPSATPDTPPVPEAPPAPAAPTPIHIPVPVDAAPAVVTPAPAPAPVPETPPAPPTPPPVVQEVLGELRALLKKLS